MLPSLSSVVSLLESLAKSCSICSIFLSHLFCSLLVTKTTETIIPFNEIVNHLWGEVSAGQSPTAFLINEPIFVSQRHLFHAIHYFMINLFHLFLKYNNIFVNSFEYLKLFSNPRNHFWLQWQWFQWLTTPVMYIRRWYWGQTRVANEFSDGYSGNKCLHVLYSAII